MQLVHSTLCDMPCCLVDVHSNQIVKALSPNLRVAGVLFFSLTGRTHIFTVTFTLNNTVCVCRRLQMDPEEFERKGV